VTISGCSNDGSVFDNPTDCSVTLTMFTGTTVAGTGSSVYLILESATNGNTLGDINFGTNVDLNGYSTTFTANFFSIGVIGTPSSTVDINWAATAICPTS
jgi:hypothetical protein